MDTDSSISQYKSNCASFYKRISECAYQSIDTLVNSVKRKDTHTFQLQSSLSSYFSICMCYLKMAIPKNVVLIFPSDEMAKLYCKEINVILEEFKNEDVQSKLSINSVTSMSCIHLPSWGAALGTNIAQYAPIRASRASHIAEFARQEPTILCCAVDVWNQYIPHKDTVNSQSLVLQLGDTTNISSIVEKLIEWKYQRVSYVYNEGEFSTRGEILDIYLSNNTNSNNGGFPVRILFDFGSIESIKTFKPENQLTMQSLDHIILHSRSEFVWSEKSINQFKEHMKSSFPEISSSILNTTVETLSIKQGHELDYMFGAFASKHPQHPIEYFERPPLLVYVHKEMILKQEEFYWNTQSDIFLSLAHLQCIPRYTRIQHNILSKLEQVSKMDVYRNLKTNNSIEIGDREAQKLSGNISYFLKYSKRFVSEGGEVFILNDDLTDLNRISSLLRTNTQLSQDRESYNISMVLSGLSQGFILPQYGIEVYTDKDLLGKKLRHVDDKKVKEIDSILQVQKGDLLVHTQYGIGKFVELTRLQFNGLEKDYVQIEYAESEKLYVPIEQLNMIQRYIGQVKEKVSLDNLGGTAWSKKKKRALQNIEDLSAELLEMQARRNKSKGYRFLNANDWEKEFIEAFEFEETDDQLSAWEEISKDMEDAKPMDRLLVGDVGFGKTELAFRAAFRAICSGKQVAFLVPTTILAEQHYYSALKRFKKFPIKIAMLSRFLNPRAQRDVIEDITHAKVDLLIGTHRIIQKDIVFKNLGLYIVDEEHRFGVKDKEKIKQQRCEVDFLALSATPIPRTLYQSMVQLRDMSVLFTPPKKRKPIQTFVEQFDEALVASAISKEIDRGGQVFYLHNRIDSLEYVKGFIEKIVPHASVLTASGQMPAADLEETMYRFIHKGANVLVSTTIIENGIDIPNVNTIIIDRADNYGIAQLYQLRGRVGRSEITAYAYLLYPNELSISELALQRLSAISDNSELGSGFKIALKDLEARGAGNLLGKEQSGCMYAIGYEHYIKLLEDTMKSMKGEHIATEPVLELTYNGYIPDTYVEDSYAKMDLYKTIVSVNSLEDYESLLTNIRDRFGPIPQELLNLLWIAKLKILCIRLFISYLKELPNYFELVFTNMASLPEDNIKAMIVKGEIKLNPKKAHSILIPTHAKEAQSLEQKYHILHSSLSKILTESK